MPDEADGRDRPTRLPLDLVLVAALGLAVPTSLVVPALADSPARLVLAVVAVFLPGYALVAALFPRGPPDASTAERPFAERVRRLDAFERTVLSAAAGLVVTPLLGIGVSFSPWPLRGGPAAAALAGFVVVAAVVAAGRRRRLPPAERYAPAKRWGRSVRATVSGGDGSRPASRLVAVVVAAAVVVAVGGILTVAATQGTGERFTEFGVLAETEEGALVTGAHARTASAGSPVSVVLEIENREGQRQTYTVVTQLQRLADSDTETRVRERESFDRVTRTVGDGRTARIDHRVTPSLTGDRLRLTFMLYRGTPPDRPTATNAYRRTHVWLDVSG